ncbi:MAG: hypothetical protein LWW85_04000 [Marinilabiliales bacterium]|nr:hypothetical protein [Marinilabiliales bacterium]
MEKKDIPQLTLEEIRSGQAELVRAMEQPGYSKAEMCQMEASSLHLRNMERLLKESTQQELLTGLQQNRDALQSIVKKMETASAKMERLTKILNQVLKITGECMEVLGVMR